MVAAAPWNHCCAQRYRLRSIGGRALSTCALAAPVSPGFAQLPVLDRGLLRQHCCLEGPQILSDARRTIPASGGNRSCTARLNSDIGLNVYPLHSCADAAQNAIGNRAGHSRDLLCINADGALAPK